LSPNDLLRDALRVDASPDLASMKEYDANEQFDNFPADCFHLPSSVELNRARRHSIANPKQVLRLAKV
jgi:hypothetical protein